VNTPFISIKTRNAKHRISSPLVRTSILMGRSTAGESHGAHAGDMLNFTADEKGKAKVTIVNKSVISTQTPIRSTAKGEPHWSWHAKADDMKTDPAATQVIALPAV